MAKRKTGRRKTGSKNQPAVRPQDASPQQAASAPKPSTPSQPPAAQLVKQHIAVQTAGPIPAPDVLRAYADILPDLPERIVSQWEKQSSHRQNLEQRVLKSNIWNERLGVLAGTVIALAGIAAGTYLISQGHDLTGLGAFLITIAAIVRVFVVGSRRSKEELQEKRSQLQQDAAVTT